MMLSVIMILSIVVMYDVTTMDRRRHDDTGWYVKSTMISSSFSTTIDGVFDDGVVVSIQNHGVSTDDDVTYTRTPVVPTMIAGSPIESMDGMIIIGLIVVLLVIIGLIVYALVIYPRVYHYRQKRREVMIGANRKKKIAKIGKSKT